MPNSMEPGVNLGPYEIKKQLGAGGMGEVWLASDARLGRKVAIKVLPSEFSSDAERLARFEQEARAAAALNHPHIAVVHDIGHQDGTHFMVQEFLEGKTLRESLQDGPLPLEKARTLATEIAEALVAAHAAGIVHRDLKPENIFITESGHAKVLDFGLAKLTDFGAGAQSGSQVTMSPTVLGTATGAIMGTAGYMAPEQVEGGDVDYRADLFAFGCVLYEMLTGQGPFRGESVYDTLHRIGHSDPKPVHEVRTDDTPVPMRWIVRKCLVKDPADRYQGAADIVVDLRTLEAAAEVLPAVADAPAVTVVPAEAHAGGVAWSRVAPVMLLLVAVAAAAGWWFRAPGARCRATAYVRLRPAGRTSQRDPVLRLQRGLGPGRRIHRVRQR